MKAVDPFPKRTAFYGVMERMNYLSREWWLEALDVAGYALLEAKIFDRTQADRLAAFVKAGDISAGVSSLSGAAIVKANAADMTMLVQQLNDHFREFEPLLNRVDSVHKNEPKP